MSFKGTISKVGMTIKKHSPEILSAIGVVATIGGVVWACKATVDAADDIKECQQDVAEIKQAVKDEIVTKKEGTKRIWAARVNCVKSVGVKYVGPVVLVGGGLYLQQKGRSIQGKRLNSLAAAYTALESRYKLLEDNVRRDYGEEELNRLKYGIHSEKGTVRRVDSDGNVTEEKGSAEVVDINKIKDFAIIFDNRSGRHQTSKYHCEKLLNSYEEQLTALLRIKKVLWLDWVLEQLDIHPSSQEEALLWHSICWTYKPGVEGHDNCVKFRYKQVFEPGAGQFEMDYNPVYILDPNYDTNINQKWYQKRG